MAKSLIGTVSSAAPDKTITVIVQTRKTHRIYKKQFTVTTKFMAHDENNDCKVGDKVVIIETKPISARKKFKLDKILQRAKLTEKDKAVIEAEETSPAQTSQAAKPSKKKVEEQEEVSAGKETKE